MTMRQPAARLSLHRIAWPTLDTLWQIVLPLSLFMVLSAQTIEPNDFWWHLRVGQWTVAEGHILTTDHFSFTRYGETWINQAWLMQVVLYLLYRAGDTPLVILAHALTVTAGYTLVLYTVARQHGVRVGVIATYVGAAVGLLDWGVRPQSVSYLGFGLLVYLIESHRHGQTRRLWWVLPLFVLWVNSHGGFVLGIGALGLYVVGQLWDFWRAGMPVSRRGQTVELAAIGLLSLLALSLNPQGPAGITGYVLGFLHSDATINRNLEFSPLVIRNLGGTLFYLSLLVLAITLVRSQVRLESDRILSLLVFVTLALVSRRNAPWYGFVLVPVLATILGSRWRAPHGTMVGKPVLNILLLSVLVVAAASALPWWRAQVPVLGERKPLISRMTPVAAMDFLCNTVPPEARVYQHQAFGSYQIWACPQLPVFIDTRIELYPSEQWRDYGAINNGRYDWETVAERYGITYLVLSVETQDVAVDAASASAAWQEVYRDAQAVIFHRLIPESPPNRRSG